MQLPFLSSKLVLRLAPTRLFVRADAERQLADDFVAQCRVGRVDSPETGITK